MPQSVHAGISVLLIMASISGCEPAVPSEAGRQPLRLGELAIAVRSGARGYFLSDKKGGFLSGEVHPGSGSGGHRWSIDGASIAEVTGDGVGGAQVTVDSASIVPDHIQVFHHDGSRIAVSPLELPVEDIHAILIEVTVAAGGHPCIGIEPAGDFSRSEAGGSGMWVWRRRGDSAVLYCLLDSGTVDRGHDFMFSGSSRGEGLLLFARREISGDSLRAIRAAVPALARGRVERMERLLNRSFLRLSDRTMTNAASWIKLSLDALVQERADTLAVAGLPWSGEYLGREIAQSIVGLGVVTGEYETAAALLRSLARHQDTVASHRTFGRIPDRIGRAGLTYSGVDVSPWFVREFYEYVTYANDTAFARLLYPVVRRSILGVSTFNTTKANVLIHGPTEVPYGIDRFAPSDGSRAPRPGRYAAVELQLLWYFQQLIGSYVADFTGDREQSAQWDRSARMSAAVFDSLFIDRDSSLLYDHLDARGRGVLVGRPNPFYALEILGDERVQQTMIRHLTRLLFYPHGPGTLAASEPGFTPYAPRNRGDGRGLANGPVSTALLGQITYALTRYDRQDLCYPATRGLAQRSLSEGVAGAIPEYLEVRPRPGAGEIRSAGLDASLAGMAEFLRAIYQDYLGIHVDAPSMVVRTEPKLPEDFTDASFTLFLGRYPVQGSYHRGAEGEDRLTLFAPELPGPLQWQFTWILKGGDAWRGAVTVRAGGAVTLVASATECVAYRDAEEVSFSDRWKITGFSRKNDIAGLGFAGTSQ